MFPAAMHAVLRREVEDFLHTHPAVADVQVFGVPSKLYGEEVCAWVKLRCGLAPAAAADVTVATACACCRCRCHCLCSHMPSGW